MIVYESNNSLAHHGILGQKWGIRRYQNKDGSLTSEGRKKYNQYQKNGELEKYKENGLTDDDSFTAKYNSDKAKKTALIVGGVVLSGAAVYAGIRWYQNNKTCVIKAGSKIQNITNADSIDLGRRFYASTNKLDNFRYGAIGGQLGIDHTNVYKNTLTAGKDLKIASNKASQEIFTKLVSNDSKFKSEIESRIESASPLFATTEAGKKVITGAKKELKRGKLGKNSYDLFNAQLAAYDFESGAEKTFIDALKNAGYSGLKDINDQKITNYMSLNPIIIFDGANKFSDIKVSELSKKQYAAGTAMVLGQGLGRAIAPTVGVVAGASLIDKAKNAKQNPELVAKYRKEHPNSKMSYDEILKNIYNK